MNLLKKAQKLPQEHCAY